MTMWTKTTDAKRLGVDWKEFEDLSRPMCHCRCGAQFRAHTKGKVYEERYIHVIEFACPGCDTVDDIWRISHDAESLSINSGDIGELV